MQHGLASRGTWRRAIVSWMQHGADVFPAVQLLGGAVLYENQILIPTLDNVSDLRTSRQNH